MSSYQTTYVIQRYYQGEEAYYLFTGPDMEPHWGAEKLDAAQFDYFGEAHMEMRRIAKGLSGAYAVKKLTELV